jgi:fluoride exporter
VYAAVSGVVLGAVLRYGLSTLWPIPPAYPAPPGFPTGGVASTSVTAGVCLFVAGFAFTALRTSNLRAFTLGVCAGAASLSQYAVIGISSVAAAGLLVLIFAPVCGLVGVAAGMFVALLFRARTSATDESVAE